MEENKEFTFEVMVTSSDLLEREIDRYNNFNNTDFKIIKITEEIEVFFCEIRTTSSLSHIFDLGFGLARYEEELRQQGKIDW
ncbi:hypothetical protein ACILE2_11635 [Capnocytophaga canimorsus]|uniref:hypothetical protein n=1 Tax=Capnocytophaga canimorsus TaxID=28188 RepID=UPI0037D89ADD